MQFHELMICLYLTPLAFHFIAWSKPESLITNELIDFLAHLGLITNLTSVAHWIKQGCEHLGPMMGSMLLSVS